jgi:subtilase family serine protease
VWPVVVAAGVAALAGAAAAAFAGGGPAGEPGPPAAHHAPPPFPACAAASPVPCYGQDPIHRVYHLGNLYARGITGAGTTIAVVMPGANPWLRANLAAYSRHMRLPPPRLQVVTAGHVRVLRGPGSTGWADEGIADTELAHFAAPGARIVYLQVPGADSLAADRASMAALGQLATRQHIAAASFSWGLFEAVIPARAVAGLRAGLVTAAKAGVSIIAATGDSGPTGQGPTGGYDPRPTVAWPASDPLVTGAGALTLHLDAAGRQIAPATVTGGQHATGAGLSALYPRPAYQDTAAAVVGSHRGVADVAVNGCAWIYTAIPHHPRAPGWWPNCGTSLAAPLFAGITALAAQAAGHRLGPVNPLLYRLHGRRDGIADVTSGGNTDHGVTGYAAGPGYDLPSGIGTIGSAPAFVTALARLAGRA